MLKDRSVFDLKFRERARIVEFADSGIACRLLTIGIVPNTYVTLVSRAPFGGALCIRLGDTLVAIRNREAKSIIVE